MEMGGGEVIGRDSDREWVGLGVWVQNSLTYFFLRGCEKGHRLRIGDVEVSVGESGVLWNF